MINRNLEINIQNLRIEMCKKRLKINIWALLLQLSLTGMTGTFFFYGGIDYNGHGIFQAFCFGTFVSNIIYSLYEFFESKKDLNIQIKYLNQLINN